MYEEIAPLCKCHSEIARDSKEIALVKKTQLFSRKLQETMFTFTRNATIISFHCAKKRSRSFLTLKDEGGDARRV